MPGRYSSARRHIHPNCPIPLSRDDKSVDSRLGIHALLVKAMEKLLAGGESFRSISVEALAREAGISRSSFYLHFKNKNELVAYSLDQVSHAITLAAGEWFERPETVSRDGLDIAVRGIIEAYDRHRTIMQAAIETAASDPAIGTAYRETLRRLMQMNRDMLRRAASGHTMHSQVTQEVSDVLLLMMERCSYQLRLIDDPAQRERIIQALSHVVWNSLFVPDGHGRRP